MGAEIVTRRVVQNACLIRQDQVEPFNHQMTLMHQQLEQAMSALNHEFSEQKVAVGGRSGS